MPETSGVDPGDGISGFGTLLAGAVSGPIGMITRLTLDGSEAGVIDITTMNTTEGWRQFIAGLKDAKGLNLDLLYQQNNMSLVQGLVGGANQSWTITLPDLSTFVVSGFVMRLGMAIPMEDKISQSAVLKFSGKPVWHSHSGT